MCWDGDPVLQIDIADRSCLDKGEALVDLPRGRVHINLTGDYTCPRPTRSNPGVQATTTTGKTLASDISLAEKTGIITWAYQTKPRTLPWKKLGNDH